MRMRELMAEVIRHQEGVVPEVFGAARQIGPGLAGGDSPGGHAESEWMHPRTVAEPRTRIGESHVWTWQDVSRCITRFEESQRVRARRQHHRDLLQRRVPSACPKASQHPALRI